MKTNTRGKDNRLTEEFIFTVLGQEDTYKKHRTTDNITKLIELYRKLVEFYS